MRLLSALAFHSCFLLSLSGAVLPALNSVYNNMLMCRFYQHISISVSSLFTSLRPLPARLAAAHPRFCSAPFQACGNGSAAFSPPARPPPRRNYASHIFNHIIHPPRTGLFHVKHSSAQIFLLFHVKQRIICRVATARSGRYNIIM